MDFEEIDEFRFRFKISAPAEAVGKIVAVAVAELLKTPRSRVRFNRGSVRRWRRQFSKNWRLVVSDNVQAEFEWSSRKVRRGTRNPPASYQPPTNRGQGCMLLFAFLLSVVVLFLI